jgi:hypothetical protein
MAHFAAFHGRYVLAWRRRAIFGRLGAPKIGAAGDKKTAAGAAAQIARTRIFVNRQRKSSEFNRFAAPAAAANGAGNGAARAFGEHFAPEA